MRHSVRPVADLNLDQRLPFSLCQLPFEVCTLDAERRPGYAFSPEEVQAPLRPRNSALWLAS